VTRVRLLAVAALALALALALLLGGVFREDSSATTRSALPAAAAMAESLQAGFAAGDTAATIRRLEEAARAGGGVRALTLLGLAYQQRARETADSTFYALSERALRRALRLDPQSADALGGLGSLALARHRFREALALGTKARELAPYTARHLGVVGDALVELGRYREAFRAFDRMVELRPTLSGYARVSYARELLGDRRGAIEAMRLALGPASGQAEATAWTHVELGKLHFGQGELAAARRHYGAALRAVPGYVHALDALAHVEAARGDRRRAIALARRAVEAVPLPQLVTTLGDLLWTSGRREEAREQYALIGAMERLLAANGVRTELEAVVFDVDHGISLRAQVVAARAARAARPSIFGDDALAWALARTGRCAEALAWSKRALRLGTRDATMFFHRGAIERCLGRREEARTWFRRALDLNPHFSLLFAPVAREALR
jgi:tetratricopeptide (TPR) repeat protein